MTIKFTPDDAVVGADEDTGDVAVYAGGSAASFYRGAWHPDIVFNRHELISRARADLQRQPIQCRRRSRRRATVLRCRTRRAPAMSRNARNGRKPMTDMFTPQPDGTHYPPTQPYGTSRPKPGATAGTTSLILGAIGLVTIVICIGAGFGPAALVAGLISRAQARRRGAPTPGTAIAGIALGVPEPLRDWTGR